jgi:hypothetical protein
MDSMSSVSKKIEKQDGTEGADEVLKFLEQMH